MFDTLVIIILVIYLVILIAGIVRDIRDYKYQMEILKISQCKSIDELIKYFEEVNKN